MRRPPPAPDCMTPPRGSACSTSTAATRAVPFQSLHHSSKAFLFGTHRAIVFELHLWEEKKKSQPNRTQRREGQSAHEEEVQWMQA